MTTDPAARTPALVLTGFLGAGKTTLVNRLLARPDAPPTAVLVNEFGDVPVDGALVVSSDDEVVELANGCVCCTIRGDLVQALADLLERRRKGLFRSARPFDRLVIETSGLASPGPVVQTLLGDPVASQELRVAGVVTLVNAERAAEQLDAFPEAREQVGYADVLVLSHVDRVDASTTTHAAERLRAVNAGAALLESALADLDLDALFGRLGDAPASDRAAGVAGEAAHAHTTGAGTVVLRSDEPLSLHTLKIWLTFLANRRTHELWRMKGILRCAEVDERVVVQSVYQYLTLEPDSGPAPDESVLVLIGRDLDPDELERGWARVRGG